MSFQSEHDPHELHLERDVFPVWEHIKAEMPNLTARILDCPVSWHEGLIALMGRFARILASAEKERVDGLWKTTCYPTLYRYTKMLVRELERMTAYPDGTSDVGSYECVLNLRTQVSVFTRDIDRLWEMADIAECPFCDQPSWECECEICPRCDMRVEDCSCERCDYCELLIDDCECERCEYCDRRTRDCECEWCAICGEHESNCECVPARTTAPIMPASPSFSRY